MLHAEAMAFTAGRLALSSPQMAIDRVACRVEMGGHGIPEATILRRYRRGLRNFFETYQSMVDEWHFYDNTSELNLIATGPDIQGNINRLNAYRKQSHD